MSVLTKIIKSHQTQARLFSTTLRPSAQAQFGGEVSKLYNNFFINGEPAWLNTSQVVEKVSGNAPLRSILDLASGPGEPACTLAKKFPSAQVTCTDISEDMLKQAEARAKSMNIPNLTCKVLSLNDLSSVAPGRYMLTKLYNL